MGDKDAYDGFGMEITPLSILQCVLTRTGMYVASPTLENVLLFLDGYVLGLEAIRLKDPESKHFEAVKAEVDALFCWARDLAMPLSQHKDWHSFSYLKEGLQSKFSDRDAFCRAGIELLEEFNSGK